MRLVIVESPYAGDIVRNTEYARAAVRDCLLRGESPLASHLLFTQPGILRDEVIEERLLGINAGFVWRICADATVVYMDLGISNGMRLGVEHSLKLNVPIEYRQLPDWGIR